MEDDLPMFRLSIVILFAFCGCDVGSQSNTGNTGSASEFNGVVAQTTPGGKLRIAQMLNYDKKGVANVVWYASTNLLMQQKSWDPFAESPALDITRACALARSNIVRSLPDAAKWSVDNITVRSLKDFAPSNLLIDFEGKWYYQITFSPTEANVESRVDRTQIVLFDGTVVQPTIVEVR